MSTRYLTGADMRNARTMSRAVFGAEPAEVLLRDQRDAIGDDVQRTEPRMAKRMDVTIANMRLDKYAGSKHQLVRSRMSFAGIALFQSGRGADLNLVPIIADVLRQCKGAAPVDSGEYQSSFRLMVNGSVRTPTPPVNGYPFGTILGVVNVAEYASTIETPEWHRTMLGVYRSVAARYFGKLDVRLRFASAGDVGTRKYAAPVIEIAHEGAMDGRTGVQTIRRRSKSQRLNMRANYQKQPRYKKT